MSAIISDQPPADGKSYEPHCARCGDKMEWVDCEQCDGTGEREYDCGNGVVENDACNFCNGEGGQWDCPNFLPAFSECSIDPLPGRESRTRGEIEWREST